MTISPFAFTLCNGEVRRGIKTTPLDTDVLSSPPAHRSEPALPPAVASVPPWTRPRGFFY
jgi:hypothetical protein